VLSKEERSATPPLSHTSTLVFIDAQQKLIALLRIYVTICKTLRVRALFGASSFKIFEDKINNLSKEGWEVKFSNMTVVQEDPSHPKEPLVAFYALMEREKPK